MSPEQAKGASAIDERADLYSVGVILYECLTGHMPFDASTVNELIFRIVLEAPPPLASFVPDLDPDLAAIVERAMAREPGERFQSARSFHDALVGWLSKYGQAPRGALARAAGFRRRAALSIRQMISRAAPTLRGRSRRASAIPLSSPRRALGGRHADLGPAPPPGPPPERARVHARRRGRDPRSHRDPVRRPPLAGSPAARGHGGGHPHTPGRRRGPGPQRRAGSDGDARGGRHAHPRHDPQSAAPIVQPALERRARMTTPRPRSRAAVKPPRLFSPKHVVKQDGDCRRRL